MRRRYALVVATIALGALSACGESQDTAGEQTVATLASPGVTAVPSPRSERPRYRLDMTAEEKDALMLPYFQCLEQHGYSFEDAKVAMDADTDTPADLRMCEETYFPLVEWERDPANPRAADFAEAVDTCMRERGVDDDTPIAEAMELGSQCERQAAESLK